MDNRNNNTDYKPVERNVKARLATLRENSVTKWKRLVTVTSWGSGRYKLDIRDWNEDMSRSTKGITFSRSEAIKLRDILTILDMNLIDEYVQHDTEYERPAVHSPAPHSEQFRPVVLAAEVSPAAPAPVIANNPPAALTADTPSFAAPETCAENVTDITGAAEPEQLQEAV